MASDSIVHQLYAPQVTADPSHKDRLFPKQPGMVKAFRQDLICAGNLRAAKWNQGGLTYMLYHSIRETDVFVIGVIGSGGLPPSHHSYLKNEIGTGKYYADIFSNLPYARKDGALEVMVAKS